MTCNRFNFIHASIVFAKKLNTHPLAEPSEKRPRFDEILFTWMTYMNDHTCTMCRYSAKQKFFGTKNTKQIPLFTTKVFLLYTKREVLWNSLQNRFSGLPNQMLKRASKDCQRNLFIDFSKYSSFYYSLLY